MGDLIVMTRPTGPTSRPPLMGESADILFFTGVRYLRVETEMSPVAPSPRRRRADKAKKTVDLQAIV